MGLLNFFKKGEGGLMDVIRCDQQEYLVYKWRPAGEANTTFKENSIRYGSSLRVKEGEVAVFVYKQEDGTLYDYIEGPVDATIKTLNLPILTNIVGAAFGGNSPFQAEIYFINLSGNIQLRFGIPFFDVFDTRFPDLGVPCAVRGSLLFNLTDYKNFIKLNRLINFEITDLETQVKDFMVRKMKSVILNIASEKGIPVVQLETRIDEISEYIQTKIAAEITVDFGVNLKRLDIGAIELDKSHPHYIQLKKTSADQQTRFIDAQTGIQITNLDENMRIQRKDTEMGVEGKHFPVHQINLQADVLKTAANSLDSMGDMDGGNGGFNAAGLMAGMSIGRAMGNQMSGMMHTMPNTPPPPPADSYHIALNGQQSGPYTIAQLKEFVKDGSFTAKHHVWKQGMAGWEPAESIANINALFASVPPPPPAP